MWCADLEAPYRCAQERGVGGVGGRHRGWRGKKRRQQSKVLQEQLTGAASTACPAFNSPISVANGAPRRFGGGGVGSIETQSRSQQTHAEPTLTSAQHTAADITGRARAALPLRGGGRETTPHHTPGVARDDTSSHWWGGGTTRDHTPGVGERRHLITLLAWARDDTHHTPGVANGLHPSPHSWRG